MERQELYAKNLGTLIKKETISKYFQTDFTKYYEFREILKEMFPHIFGAVELEDYQGSMLLRWKGKDSSHPVLFMNHMDVVDVEGEWTHPAFSGEVFDGKLWGRGTLDTKGGLWGMLQAADELAAEGFIPEHDIYLESSDCEETSFEGAEHFGQVLYDRGIRFDYVLDEGGMITYEPLSGAKGTYAMIGMGERGCSDLKFIARGAGGHASTPDDNSPLVRLGKFMAEVEKDKIFEVQVSPVIKEMLRRLAPSMSGALKTVYANPGVFEGILKIAMPKLGGTPRALVQSTIAFTMAEGSCGRNVIPTEASVIGNMRVSHHQGFKSSLAAVKAVADKYDIETVVLEEAIDSPLADYKTPEFAMMEDAVKAAFPAAVPCPYIMTGCSDARFMGKLTDNCYHFVPFLVSKEQIGSIHSIDECVDVSTLAPAVDFYKHLMSRR